MIHSLVPLVSGLEGLPLSTTYSYNSGPLSRDSILLTRLEVFHCTSELVTSTSSSNVPGGAVPAVDGLNVGEISLQVQQLLHVAVWIKDLRRTVRRLQLRCGAAH